MARTLRIALWACLCSPVVFAVACKGDGAGRVTQMIVDVDAEPGLHARIAELQVEVAGSDGRGNLDRRLERLMQRVRPGAPGEPEWPVRIALVPRDGDAARVFELSATALDADGDFLANARIVSGYVESETRYVRLLIQASCIGQRCGELETCDEGVCGDAWRDPNSLVRFTGQPDAPGDAGALDAGEAGDAGPDAGTDAGADGAVPPNCEQDDARCADDVLYVCDGDGTWDEGTPCAYACIDGACAGECVPDTQRCNGPRLQSCEADATWSTVTICPFVCEPRPDIAGQFRCGGSCAPGTTRCDSVAQLATCDDDGDFGPPATCDDQACGGTPAACVGECSPESTRCADSTTLQVCGDAGFYAETDCAALDQACVETAGAASCSGDCAPGQTTCIDGDAHDCNAGAWAQADDCTPPGEICRAGACEPNDPYTVGAATAGAGWTDFDPPNDTWYVIPVVAPATANVLAVRILARAAGGTARLAIWQDNGGAPGAFLAQTDNIGLSAGVGSDAPIPLATQVTATSTYWIGAKFTSNAALYQNASASLTGYAYGQTFGTNPATTMNPFPAGSATAFSNVNFNFFLLVQDVEQ